MCRAYMANGQGSESCIGSGMNSSWGREGKETEAHKEVGDVADRHRGRRCWPGVEEDEVDVHGVPAAYGRRSGSSGSRSSVMTMILARRIHSGVLLSMGRSWTVATEGVEDGELGPLSRFSREEGEKGEESCGGWEGEKERG